MFYKVMAVMFLDMLTSIGLTLLAILMISLLLTVDLTISFLSCAAVAATVVDTAGLAHFWGLVVEPFFAVLLENRPLFSIIGQPLPRCCSLSPPGSLSTTPPTWGTASLSRFSFSSKSNLQRHTKKVVFFLFHRKFSGRRQQNNPGLNLPRKALHVDPDPA